MSSDWYLMGSKPVFMSGMEKEEFDAYAADSFNEILDESPISKTIEIYSSDLSIIQEVKAIIQGNLASTELKTMDREVLLPIGVAHAGMYVRYKNKYWLILGLVDNNGMYEKALITLCQWDLKWQDEQGVVHNRWVNVVSNAQYNVGITSNKTITLGSDQLLLTVPIDENTLELDDPQRFFVGYGKKIKTYKTTRPDTVPYYYGENDGVIPIVITQDELRDSDNKDLMICDYFTPSPIPPTPIPSTTYSKITYKSLPEIKLGGNVKNFTVTFYDENNNVLTNLTPKWSIKSDFDGVILLETSNPNVVSLKASGANSLIGKTFTLQVSDIDDENISELTITIVSLI